MRVTLVKLLQKLCQMIAMARIEPVIVSRRGRDNDVIISAEAYASLQQAARKVRLTGSLTMEEREPAAAATIPSKADQKRYLAELAVAHVE
jgi:prevent-host-death family protein